MRPRNNGNDHVCNTYEEYIQWLVNVMYVERNL